MRPNTAPEDMLRESVANGNIAPAYIFLSCDEKPALSLALYFAKLLNCAEKDCHTLARCAPCSKIDSGAHPDVLSIEPENPHKGISIDEVRELKRKVYLKPFEAKVKVFIIKKAHLLSQESSNALLKTLEEPPGNSAIILLSESLDMMLSTIVSRSRVVRLAQNWTGDKETETLNEEIDRALIFLRDAFVLKATGNKHFLLTGADAGVVSRSTKKSGMGQLETDIKKLIELKDNIRFNANPKIVRDVFSGVMRQYK